ncbi:MAG: RIP metalloprotease RseP [Cyanobacteriota bacterium]|nr:RIP metalloprotease RseP [Cyanobacteriota bacterium]
MFIAISIGILALLILVHEAGHFAAAKWQGIHVNRFSLGFGPILWSWQGQETEYALRLLPLGGFVGFPDQEEDCPYPANDPDLLKNRPVLDRLVVMAAGVMANLLFAYLVLATMFGTVGIPEVAAYQPGILIPQVLQASPAQQAGLQSGDVVVAAADQDYRQIGNETEATEAIDRFQKLIQSHGGQPLSLQVERSQQILSLTVVPQVRGSDSPPVIGVNLAPHQQRQFRAAQGIPEILGQANQAYKRLVQINVDGFRQLIQNFQNTANQVSGPVGIVKMGADLAESDAVSLFNFTALISINLAILNLLPLPALDGGHIAFLLLEALRGKRLPRQIEERVMHTGLVVLMGLGIVLIFKDTIALVVGAG